MDYHQTEQAVHESDLGVEHVTEMGQSLADHRFCSSNSSASPGSFPLASIDGHR